MGSALKSVKEVHGYVCVTASAILWGTLGIFAKFSFEYACMHAAAVFSMILLGESLEQPQMIGIAVALIGVVLLFRMGKTTTASARTEKAE